MDTGELKKTRTRELPRLPQHRQRALPTTLGEDRSAVEHAPAGQIKKKTGKTKKADDDDAAMMEMGGLRASQIRDVVTPDPTTGPQKRKKKKKTVTGDLEDDHADLVNAEAAEQTTDGEEVLRKPKKRKKKRLKGVEAKLSPELDVEEDDIISDGPPTIPHHSLFTAPQGQSQPVGKIFVERSKGFQAEDRSELKKPNNQVDQLNDYTQPSLTTKDVSVKVHETFRKFGLYCHGFLAGFAVWNVVVVFTLAGRQLGTLTNLLQQYQSMAYLSQSLLYLLISISTVATFDRMNLARGWAALRAIITLEPVALASFLYFSALVLSLSQQMTSDRINLYTNSNGTLWTPGSEHKVLQPWVMVNLVVALLVSLAWILTAVRPQTDYTEGWLMTMETEPPKTENKSEIIA